MLVFSCASVTIGPVLIKQVIDWCLHCIRDKILPFLSVIFHCKSIIFVNSQESILCYGHIIFFPLQRYYTFSSLQSSDGALGQNISRVQGSHRGASLCRFSWFSWIRAYAQIWGCQLSYIEIFFSRVPS